MKYIYVLTGIKRELVRFGVGFDVKGKIVRIVGRTVVIHSSRQIIFGFTHIEGITLGAAEEVDELAGGANGMCGSVLVFCFCPIC